MLLNLTVAAVCAIISGCVTWRLLHPKQDRFDVGSVSDAWRAEQRGKKDIND